MAACVLLVAAVSESMLLILEERSVISGEGVFGILGGNEELLLKQESGAGFSNSLMFSSGGVSNAFGRREAMPRDLKEGR